MARSKTTRFDRMISIRGRFVRLLIWRHWRRKRLWWLPRTGIWGDSRIVVLGPVWIEAGRLPNG